MRSRVEGWIIFVAIVQDTARGIQSGRLFDQAIMLKPFECAWLCDANLTNRNEGEQ